MLGLKIALPERRLSFHVMREKAAIETLITDLPEDEVIKLISFGTFSLIGLIRFVADKVRINHLTVSSLAVGAKHAECLDVMAEQGNLGHAEFYVGTVMGMDRKTKTVKRGMRDRGYVLKGIAEKRGWEVVICKNHSKILLMDTDRGRYVVETSSNLNENPKFEQFSFEKNDELYDFYRSFFDGLKRSSEEAKNG